MENNHEKNRQGELEPKERNGSEAGRELPVPQERKSGSGKAMTGQQLGEAARDGDAAKVSTLLSTQGAQSFINYQDALGRTPLHIAAANGHASVTQQLIAARCIVDLEAEEGFTALHCAAGNGHEAVTEQLIAARCNVDLQEDKYGGTPLHVAAHQGHEPVTKQLIAARCNVDLKTNNGLTALQVAERQGHAGVATMIRNRKHKGADRGKKDTLLQASPAQTKKQQEDADRAFVVNLSIANSTTPVFVERHQGS
jgi:ankyrin repeat protein